MRPGLFVWMVAAGLALPLTAGAQLLTRTPLDTVLVESPSRAALRARLAAWSDSMAATAASEAALALAQRARSFAREGEVDSAVACQERALALDSRPEHRLRLAEVLVARLDPGDAVRARGVLRPIQPRLPHLPDLPGDAPVQALFAWTHYLAGNADSAAILMAPLDSWLSPEPEWRYRLACIALERGEWTRALALLVPLAVRSRLQDTDVMDMTKRCAESLNSIARMQPMLARELAQRDAVEQELLTEFRARRIVFAARDRFPLGGILLAPAGRAAPRAAVVLMAPGDTLAAYDSLAIGLRRLGLAVLLLEPRGTGHSVGPPCPSPETWRGREVEMQTRVAQDVRSAVAALAREAKADTARYLLVGVGAMGPVAVEAAALDRRATALLLVSPAPDPVDRGTMRTGLAALRRPVYFQTGPEDFITWDVMDALYRACDPRTSRVADSDRPGHFATLFRRDPRIMERFKLWLSESWPPARRATRPAPPRPR